MLSPRMQKDLFLCSLLREHKREGECCIQNTLFPPCSYLALLVRKTPLWATNCCTLKEDLVLLRVRSF